MSVLRSLPVVGPYLGRVRPDRVAILRLYGPIGGGARSADWIELVRRLRESKRVPAVALDVDSPGGSATASDDMFIALERLAARKPLVAAIRGVGASGSYLAALAAPWREDTDEERDKEQAIVDAFYDAFVERVATGRHITTERARELATGEVWLGRDALGLGLIDEVGDLERAVEIAAERAGIPAKSAPVRIRRPLFARLAGSFGTSVAASVADELEMRLGSRLRT